jgi:hypothetical protein
MRKTRSFIGKATSSLGERCMRNPKNQPGPAGLTRREFLGLAGKAGLVSGSVLLLGDCKSSPTSPPPPPPPPPPVHSNVLVRFYNHTQGYIGDRTYDGMSGSLLPIKASDCPDISTVNSDRIAVREAANGGWLGKLIEFSINGQLNSAKFPRQDMTYDAFLMNKTNGADYSLIDYNTGLLHSPNATWDREDVDATGNDAIPHEAMRQIKEALTVSWAKYMDFRELQPYVRGDFWVGYAPGPYPASNPRGSWSEICAWVNPQIIHDEITQLRVFVEMICGHIIIKETFASNYVNPPTYEYITNNNGLNEIGRDILACSVVKDHWYVT